MLSGFPGTVIFVSHDRYFVKRVATQIMEMSEDGVRLYPFGYDDYIEKKQMQADAPSGEKEKEAPDKEPEVSASQAARLAAKEAERCERRRQKLEEKIEQLESRIGELKEEMGRPEYASMYSKLTEIQEEIDRTEEELLSTMELWEENS